jgi:hypothetical protein
MDDLLLQIGVGGVFAIMVLREVFKFLEKQREKKGNGKTAAYRSQHASSVTASDARQLGIEVSRIENKIDVAVKKLEGMQGPIFDMHRWHDVDDPTRPGAKLWWGVCLSELNASVKVLADETRLLRQAMEDHNNRRGRTRG